MIKIAEKAGNACNMILVFLILDKHAVGLSYYPYFEKCEYHFNHRLIVIHCVPIVMDGSSHAEGIHHDGYNQHPFN